MLALALLLWQPGPSKPLTLGDARALGERMARDEASMASSQREAQDRVRAARDRAEAFDELYRALQSPVAGGARSIDDGAEREIRTRTGLSFADFRRGSTPAWRRCADLVRTLHLVNDDARKCLVRAAEDRFGSAVALSAFALGGVEIESGDYEAAIARLAPSRGDYDADLTVAVANIGLGRLEQADALLAEIIRRDPARPEAHYDRALLAATRRYESQKTDWVTAQDRRAFLHFRAFLCRRDGVKLRAPGDSWKIAAQGAEDAERRLTGRTHWSWPSSGKRAQPFLPEGLLPADMRDDPGHKPSTTCAQVMSEVSKRAASSESPPPRRRSP